MFRRSAGRDSKVTVVTEGELRKLGEFLFEGLKSGSIAIEEATDQAAVKNKRYATIEDLVGIVLHGRFPHEFHVAVVQAWEGSSITAPSTIELYRPLFFEELLRLVPHDGLPTSEQAVSHASDVRSSAGLATSDDLGSDRESPCRFSRDD